METHNSTFPFNVRVYLFWAKWPKFYWPFHMDWAALCGLFLLLLSLIMVESFRHHILDCHCSIPCFASIYLGNWSEIWCAQAIHPLRAFNLWFGGRSSWCRKADSTTSGRHLEARHSTIPNPKAAFLGTLRITPDLELETTIHCNHIFHSNPTTLMRWAWFIAR